MLAFHLVDDKPKRGRPRRAPLGADIRAARVAAGLSPEQCAELVHASSKTWERWEGGSLGMHPGLWELFQLKASELPN